MITQVYKEVSGKRDNCCVQTAGVAPSFYKQNIWFTIKPWLNATLFSHILLKRHNQLHVKLNKKVILLSYVFAF